MCLIFEFTQKRRCKQGSFVSKMVDRKTPHRFFLGIEDHFIVAWRLFRVRVKIQIQPEKDS